MQENIAIELRKLNFQKLIMMAADENYSYAEYTANGYEHNIPKGYCTACEDNGCNKALDDQSFKLRNISHGTHSDDFFEAAGNLVDTTGWHQEAVVFVYEAPSSEEHDAYQVVKFHGHEKAPPRKWFWVDKASSSNEHLLPIFYPSGFKATYDEFLWSTINTFRLSNVYITNLVKCGMNDASGKNFKPLASISPECVKTCFGRFLKEELGIFNPRVVFAMGRKVEELLNKTFGVRPVYYLPHPGKQRYGTPHEHFRVLYFWLICEALLATKIISRPEAIRLAELFLKGNG